MWSLNTGWMEACSLEEHIPLLWLRTDSGCSSRGGYGRRQCWASKLVALAWNTCPIWNMLGAKPWYPPCRTQKKGLCHCLFRLAQLPLGFPTSAVTQLKDWAVVPSWRDMLESIPCRELQIASNCFPRQVSMKTSQDFHSFFFSCEISFFSFLLTLLVKLSGQFWKGIKSLSLLPSWSQNLF